MTKVEEQDGFPVIETDTLVLRQITMKDAAVLYQYWSDPEVTEYLTLEPFAAVQEAVAMIGAAERAAGKQAGN